MTLVEIANDLVVRPSMIAGFVTAGIEASQPVTMLGAERVRVVGYAKNADLGGGAAVASMVIQGSNDLWRWISLAEFPLPTTLPEKFAEEASVSFAYTRVLWVVNWDPAEQLEPQETWYYHVSAHLNTGLEPS